MSVALVLLGTGSDSPPLNWSGELQSREFLKRTVKTQQHNGQWAWLWFGLWGDHGKPDGNLVRLLWAREVRAYADTASWAGARPSPERKQRPRVCSAVLSCSFCLSVASYQILFLWKIRRERLWKWCGIAIKLFIKQNILFLLSIQCQALTIWAIKKNAANYTYF